MQSLKSQAYKFLGSVDFLGNPLGLAHDVREGFAAVVQYGDLSQVFQGATRGVANSASKVKLEIRTKIKKKTKKSKKKLKFLVIF